MATRFLKALFCLAPLLGLVGPAWAAEENRHCPDATPQNSFVFMTQGSSPENEKRRLDTLAAAILKQKSPVCILALTNPADLNHSKKLAIKRVLWARDNLLAAGVPPNQLSAELRPAEPDQDKSGMQEVKVIVGR